MDSYFKNVKMELEKRGLRPHSSLDDLIRREENEGVGHIPQARWYEYLFYRIESFFTDYLFNKTFYKRIWYRLRYGFDPADAWDLDIALARWLLPRLKYLRETGTHPGGMTPEEWDSILDKIIWSFEFYLDDLSDYADEEERFREGLKLFAEYYDSLWD